MAPSKPRGFAIPGYASAAGKKGHALGVTRRFKPGSLAARNAGLKRLGTVVRDASGKFVKVPEP